MGPYEVNITGITYLSHGLFHAALNMQTNSLDFALGIKRKNPRVFQNQMN